MTTVINPMLEEDEDEVQEPAEEQQPQIQLVVPEREFITASGPRKGTPRVRVTNRDAVLLAFLAKFRIATADSLSMLLKAEAFPSRKGGPVNQPSGQCTSIDVTRKRLQKMEGLGLVLHKRLWSGELYYTATKAGHAAAQDFGYLYHPHEADRAGWKDIDPEGIPHDLAVAAVAARFASEAQMMGNLPVVPMERLISEHQLRAAVSPHEIRLANQRKEDNPSGFGLTQNAEAYFWGNYRHSRIGQLRHEAGDDLAEWEMLINDEPELFVLGHPTTTTENIGAQKHFPDLVIQREEHRDSKKPVSWIVEVERNRKRNGGYDTIVNTFAEEMKRGMIAKICYATNSTEVRTALTRADRKMKTNLVERKLLQFMPIRRRDGAPWDATKK